MDRKIVFTLIVLSLTISRSTAFSSRLYEFPSQESKRQRENNQFTSTARIKSGTPSCEQLRLLWKLSKRQQRNSALNNRLPRDREAYLLGRISNTLRHDPIYDAQRPAAQPTYGTVVRDPAERRRHRPDDTPALRQLARAMPDDPRPTPSSLRQLARMLDRAPESKQQEQHFGTVRVEPHATAFQASPAARLYSRRVLPASYAELLQA